MIKKKVVLAMSSLLAVGALMNLASCSPKYDVKLVVYNWEDYIFEGEDENGKFTLDSMVEMFEKQYKEDTGLVVKVFYETFSTNEIMYQQIDLGAIKPDLICPSDYMIQKMANNNMLEKFSYNKQTKKYGESLQNYEDYGSPYIKARFENETLNDGSLFSEYAIPYFWGTMGFTYDPSYFTPEQVSSWECLWNNDKYFENQFSLKDSMRDSYVTAIFHVYKDEIAQLDENDPEFTSKLNEIFNRCDDDTIAKVETALKEAKSKTVRSFEVDEGKNDIVRGLYHANLAWSGDAVFSMDSAETSKTPKELNYSLPEEGSNVWFDGWVMPKGANKELAEQFINFICAPENAALNMNAVGYTSPIVGADMWDLVNDWYAAEDDEEDTYEVDLTFYFGQVEDEEGKLTDATIEIPTSQKGRQFDAQYPTEDVLKRCCIMKDFGEQTSKVEAMWARVKRA